jgi:PAS domain S-box-containing protein
MPGDTPPGPGSEPATHGELETRLRETAALLAVARVVGTTTDLSEAFRLICRELARLTGAETVAAYVVDPAGRELRPVAGYHVPRDALEVLATASLPLAEEGFSEGLFGQGRVVWSDDVQRDPRFAYPLFRRLPHQSGLVIPLAVAGRVSGGFYLVWWRERRSFTPAELSTLGAIGEQAGVLLHTARLYARAQLHAKRLETLTQLARTISASLEPDIILPAVADAVLSLYPTAVCRLWTVEGDRLQLRGEAGAAAAEPPGAAELEVGRGLVGRVAASGRPRVIEDLDGSAELSPAERALARGFGSLVVLPLAIAEHAVGVFGLFSPERRAFADDEVKVLEAFAEHAAVALAKARLFQDIQDRRRLTEDLYVLTAEMTRNMDIQHRVDAFVQGARAALGFDRLHVLLATADGSALELVAGTDLDPAGRRLIPLAGAGACQAVWESGSTLVVSTDAELERLPRLAPELRDHPVLRARRFAVVPLTSQGRPMGVVVADNKPSRRPITRRRVAHLELFCQQLANSVNNARLYGETRQRERDATILLEVARKLSSTLELEQVLDIIADSAVEALGCAAAGFYRWDAGRGGLVFARGRNLDAETRKTLLLRPGEGVAGRAYAERRPVSTQDRVTDTGLRYSPENAARIAGAPSPRAYLAAPIVIRDEVYGVLLACYFEPHVWAEREVHLLSSLAAQAAVAIENARLYTATQQNLAGAALLNEAARTLHRTLDVKRLLPDAVATLARTFGAVGAAVVLFEDAAAPAARVVRWGAWSDDQVRRLAEPLRWREAPLLIPDATSRPDLVPPELLDEGPRGVAAFPVRGRSRVLGGLILLFPDVRALAEAETRLLAAYADQLAMALDNAALFEEAENRKTQLEQVFASTSDGFLVLDLEGRIVALNQQGGELLGVGPEQVMRRPFARLVEMLDRAVAWEDKGGKALVEAVEKRAASAGDLELRVPERRTLRWQTTPTRDLLGNTVGVTVTFRDVTREREIDRMKTEFVSTVSHELRTPLSSIKGSLHLLLSDPGLQLDDTQRRLIDISVKNTDRLIRLINNILDVSKIEAGRMTLELGSFRPAEFITMAVEGIRGFADSRGVGLVQEVPDDLPALQVDFDRMVQVVTNLLSNAIKFSPVGGRVTVAARDLGGEVEIRVIDQGRGIAPQDMGRLFHKFQQLDGSTVREVGGTGLGLAICRGIVEEHGGRIGVESQLGAGATFIVTLPAPRAEGVAEAGPAQGAEEAPLVLVVDDEPDIRTLLHDQLELEGFRVISAGRALEAIELAREHRPDVITMDLMLPDLDGFETIRLLREHPETRETPVVLLTAVEVEPGDSRALGATVYLTKPFSNAALLKAIRANLRAPRGVRS